MAVQRTGLNLDNERRYLSNLAQTGNAGERAWAEQQARAYGISLTPTPAPTRSPDQIMAMQTAPRPAATPAPAPATPRTSTTGLNLDNERRYLSNLAQTGNAGERAWAEQQARAYGISLIPASTLALTPTLTRSPDQAATGTPLTHVPAPTPIGAGGLGGVSPTSVPRQYTPAPTISTSVAPASVSPAPAASVPGQGTAPIPQKTLAELLTLINSHFQGVMYPYQEFLEQLMANQPTRDVQTWDQIMQRSREHANLIFDPQVSALTRTVEQQRQAAAAQRAAVEAAYGTVEARTRRLLDDAQARALESAVARGGGRSGAVEWLMERLQAPILEHQQQAEESRVAKTMGITDALTLNERQIAERAQELEGLRGRTAAQQAQAMQEVVYAQQTGDWQRAFDAARTLSAKTTGAANQAQATALALLPYVMPTWEGQEDAARQLAIALGQTPRQPGAGGGVQGQPSAVQTPGQPVPVRQYVESAYGPQYIGFDSARQEVIIGNYRIAVNRLSEYGGFLRNGQAHLPQSVIDRLMQGR